MATPNYSFEKRKRELAKKAAKEAKRLRKAEQAVAPETVVSSPESTEDTSPHPKQPEKCEAEIGGRGSGRDPSSEAAATLGPNSFRCMKKSFLM